MSELVICFFFLIVIILCLSFTLKSKMISLTKNNLDDGLSLSTLAAVIIDLEEYASNGNVILKEDSYDIFIETLKTNLKLDVNLDSINPIYYKSVNVKKFIIYNVVGNDVIRVTYDNGACKKEFFQNEKENLLAENGEIINVTSIYTEIEVEIEGFMGSECIPVTVSNLMKVDKSRAEKGDENEKEENDI